MPGNVFSFSDVSNEKLKISPLSDRDESALIIERCIQQRYKKRFVWFILISISPRQNVISTWDTKGDVLVFDLEKNLFWQIGNEDGVSILKFYPCHNRIAIGFITGLIKIIDSENGHNFNIFERHVTAIKNICYNETGDQCLSICSVKGYVWNPFTYKILLTLEPHENAFIREALFVPWNDKLVIYTSNNLLSMWDSRSNHFLKRFHSLDLLGCYINTIAFNRNGTVMLIGGNCSKIISVHTSSWQLKQVHKLPGTLTQAKHVEFVPLPFDEGENSIVAVLTFQEAVIIFDLQDRFSTLYLRPLNADIIKSINISSAGRYFVCLMGWGNVTIFNNMLWRRQQGINIQKNQKSIHDAAKHTVYKVFALTKYDLHNIIHSYGQFPDDMRPFLWRIALALPMNILAHQFLSEQGLHPSFEDIQDYPFLPLDLRFRVMSLASNLAHWCPIFGRIKYLPLMVLRFVKVFKSSPLMAFEAVVTAIVNYCQSWFFDIPFFPNKVTNYIQSLIQNLDAELWEHFLVYNIRLDAHMWTIMETLFSEVLIEKDWLILWDNVFTHGTDYLTVAVAEFYIMNRKVFLMCESKEQFEFVMHKPVNINIKLFTHQVKFLSKRISSQTAFKKFRPLQKGDSYPLFLENTDELIKNLDMNLQKILDNEKRELSEQIHWTGEFSIDNNKYSCKKNMS